MSDSIEHLYKILVVGDVNTGKTSIIKRYVHNIFSSNYKSTIGVDFALKVLNWNDNTVIRLQLWDIAGQERHGSMTRVYYKEAVGAMVVYDVTKLESFNDVIKWRTDIAEKVFLPDNRPIPCILIGNKCDLENKIGKSKEDLNQFCEDFNFSSWFYTSAKDGKNIETACKFLVQKILDCGIGETQDDKDKNNDVVNIGNDKDGKKNGGCCGGGSQN